jgi:hypothetical protein
LPYRSDVARGFPVIEAHVDFAGWGYPAWMGWIQVVQYTYGDDLLEVIVDRPPAVLDTDVPFLASGPCPSLFDAPSTTRVDARWRADDFLVASPDAVMTKAIKPVYSFSWGYESDADGHVTPTPPQRQEFSAWGNVQHLIASRHPAWRLIDP